MNIYGQAVLEVTATNIFLLAYVLTLAVTWRTIHWFSHERRGSVLAFQEKACESLEDFEEFLWCLDLGMDSLDGIVIREGIP